VKSNFLTVKSPCWLVIAFSLFLNYFEFSATSSFWILKLHMDIRIHHNPMILPLRLPSSKRTCSYGKWKWQYSGFTVYLSLPTNGWLSLIGESFPSTTIGRVPLSRLEGKVVHEAGRSIQVSEIWPILAMKIYSPAKNSWFFGRLAKISKDNREIKKKLINITSERVTQMSCLVMEKHTPMAFFLTQPSPSGDWDGRSQSSHIYCFLIAHSSCLNPHENWWNPIFVCC
jgi:hypothetical protein